MRRVEFEPYIFSESVEIYAIKFEDEVYTEFKKFFIMFKDSEDKYIKDDLARIIKSIEKIVINGALESYFRREGSMSDRVCAIPLLISLRNKNRYGTLRLYCLRISDKLLIIGGGGLKDTQTYQDSAQLLENVKHLQSIDERLKYLENLGVDISDKIINLHIEIEEYE